MLYRIKICGTVFSGHPTRTTLGNTLRVMLYITYNIFLLDGLEEAIKTFFSMSDKYYMFVLGDDVQVDGELSVIMRLK